MHSELGGLADNLVLAGVISNWLFDGYLFLKVLIGFSIIIFVHELGHFLAAKWMGIRIDRFAIGFFHRVCGYRRGEGFTFGKRPEYTQEELATRGYGETDYCLNAMPFGGYVKMLGQEDIQINEETGEVKTSDDPRAFPNKSIGRRMIVVSAGVLFNVFFAVFVYMFVFLALGKDMPAPLIGQVDPASAAANAGLMPGDRVVAIDGDPVSSFDDIGMAWMLAGDTMRFRVKRGGQPLDQDLVVKMARHNGEKDLIGIAPMYTADVSDTIIAPVDKQGPQPGDKITRVNGVDVKSALEIVAAFQVCGGKNVELTVEREDPGQQGSKQTAVYSQRPLLRIVPTVTEGDDSAIKDSQYVLGFLRRLKAETISEQTPAAKAGFRAGDVVAQWGTVANPRYADMIASIYANDGKPVSVVVERDGKPVDLTVSPRSPLRFFGSAKPRVGISFGYEDRRPIVADVVLGTPAAELGMPRGSEIVAIGGQPVKDWFGVVETLRAAAGTTVELRYRTGDDEAAGQMVVPSSIVNELDLPPTARIVKIDGRDKAELPSGGPATLPAPAAVQRLLEANIGRAVTVEYVPSFLEHKLLTKPFKVREDNIDPWQLRINYDFELLRLSPLTEKVDAGGNPLVALSMGAKYTARDLWRMYRIVQNIVTQNVGVQHVAGPVGIFSYALRFAKTSLADLLVFLAFISLNLAVINFMPLPVVDGGMMAFLILEKIRGKPLSVKVQVATTLTGLALIVLSFLFVTIQDITKLFSGS